MQHLNILALIGSTKDHSSNYKLVKFLKNKTDPAGLEGKSKKATQPLNTSTNSQTITQQQVVLHWDIFPISGLPFFDPDLDKVAPLSATKANAEHVNDEDMDTTFEQRPAAGGRRVPTVVQQLRDKVSAADAVLICTPEYIFSLPGILKNALEWLVATTALENKPMALITAAASGEKAKESLELIIKTLGGKFTEQTSIHIRGIAGKFDSNGQLNDPALMDTLQALLHALKALALPEEEPA